MELDQRRATTPLHEAARNGHTEIVQALISAGADVHALDGPSKSRTAVCLDVGSLPAALPARINVCLVFHQERTG